MGPQLRFTDDQYNLLHSEDYPEEWYNQTFLNRDWLTLKEEFTGIDNSIYMIVRLHSEVHGRDQLI